MVSENEKSEDRRAKYEQDVKSEVERFAGLGGGVKREVGV